MNYGVTNGAGAREFAAFRGLTPRQNSSGHFGGSLRAKLLRRPRSSFDYALRTDGFVFSTIALTTFAPDCFANRRAIGVMCGLRCLTTMARTSSRQLFQLHREDFATVTIAAERAVRDDKIVELRQITDSARIQRMIAK